MARQAGPGELTGAGSVPEGLLCFRRDGKSLERFVDDYLAGRLKPYVKSEPVPERNADAVKVRPEPRPPCVCVSHTLSAVSQSRLC